MMSIKSMHAASGENSLRDPTRYDRTLKLVTDVTPQHALMQKHDETPSHLFSYLFFTTSSVQVLALLENHQPAWTYNERDDELLGNQ
jgi:hypothetical protein